MLAGIIIGVAMMEEELWEMKKYGGVELWDERKETKLQVTEK